MIWECFRKCWTTRTRTALHTRRMRLRSADQCDATCLPIGTEQMPVDASPGACVFKREARHLGRPHGREMACVVGCKIGCTVHNGQLIHIIGIPRNTASEHARHRSYCSLTRSCGNTCECMTRMPNCRSADAYVGRVSSKQKALLGGR